MEFGPVEDVLEARRAQGFKISKLDEKPELYPDLEDVWRAFCELSVGRSSGFGGPEPIRRTEVAAWLDLNGIEDRETRVEYSYFIAELDIEWLSLARKKKGRRPSADDQSRDRRPRR